MKIDPKFIVQRQGRDHVLYAGLLDEAHRQGLLSIKTSILQFPAPENGNTCIAHAAVEIEKVENGSARVLHFEGIGDANEANVGRMIAAHLIRMAETRAKARALRDAVNVGAASLEELGDDDEPAPVRQPQRAPAQQREDDEAWDQLEAGTNPPKAAPTPINRPAANGNGPSDAQLAAIYGIGKGKGLDRVAVQQKVVAKYGRIPEALSKSEASDLITALKGN